jgi:hypothetical protein
MDVARPYSAISPALDGTVLAVLAGTTRPLTGREIARLAGRRSHSGVLDVLNRLSEHGLVERQEAGRALLFTLNREHLSAPAVELLAGMRAELLSRVGTAVGQWKIQPVHVSLFGSTARGDGDTSSDIDLLVVRAKGVDAGDPHWRQQVDDLAVSIRRWTGNPAAIADVGEAQLDRLRAPGSALGAELRSDAIAIHGPAATVLLRAKD